MLHGFTFFAISSTSYLRTQIANITINNKALTHRVIVHICDRKDLLRGLKSSSHESITKNPSRISHKKIFRDLYRIILNQLHGHRLNKEFVTNCTGVEFQFTCSVPDVNTVFKNMFLLSVLLKITCDFIELETYKIIRIESS